MAGQVGGGRIKRVMPILDGTCLLICASNGGGELCIVGLDGSGVQAHGRLCEDQDIRITGIVWTVLSSGDLRAVFGTYRTDPGGNRVKDLMWAKIVVTSNQIQVSGTSTLCWIKTQSKPKAYDINSEFIVAGEDNGDVMCWRSDSGIPVARYRAGVPEPCLCISICGSSSRVWTSSRSGAVRVLDFSSTTSRGEANEVDGTFEFVLESDGVIAGPIPTSCIPKVNHERLQEFILS